MSPKYYRNKTIMTEKILRAKHWQLFLIIFVIPFLLVIMLMYQLFESTYTDVRYSYIDQLFTFFQLGPSIIALSMCIFFYWLWSVGKGLNSKISKALKSKTTILTVCLIYQLLYLILMVILVYIWASGWHHRIKLMEPILEFVLDERKFIPLHLIFFTSVIYSIYFAAKKLVTAEQKRKPNFIDFVGEFFLIWFFFIGVWVLQIRINRISEDNFKDTVINNLIDD